MNWKITIPVLLLLSGFIGWGIDLLPESLKNTSLVFTYGGSAYVIAKYAHRNFFLHGFIVGFVSAIPLSFNFYDRLRFIDWSWLLFATMLNGLILGVVCLIVAAVLTNRAKQKRY